MLHTLRQRPFATRWALWVFAAALVLKAAMPWLASASAELQGKTVVEVCTVYGVSLVPVSGEHPEGSGTADHASGHCVLNGLGAFAGLDTPTPSSMTAVPLPASTAPRTQPSAQAPDACATWVARLKHGPPRLS